MNCGLGSLSSLPSTNLALNASSGLNQGLAALQCPTTVETMIESMALNRLQPDELELSVFTLCVHRMNFMLSTPSSIYLPFCTPETRITTPLSSLFCSAASSCRLSLHFAVAWCWL